MHHGKLELQLKYGTVSRVTSSGPMVNDGQWRKVGGFCRGRREQKYKICTSFVIWLKTSKMCCFLVRSQWRNRGGVWWLRLTGRPSWRLQWMATCLHCRRACMNLTSLWEESLSEKMALLTRCLFACVQSNQNSIKKRSFLNCCIDTQVNPRLDGCMKEWRWLTGEDTSIQETIQSNDNMQCFSTEDPGAYYPGTGFAFFNISYGELLLVCVCVMVCVIASSCST